MIPHQPNVEATSAIAPPTAPPTVTREAGEVDLLLIWVRERDVPCPRCGYNLRNLTTPVCPECREELRLCVGAQRVRYEWLIATLAPGIFSGIAAMLLLIPIAIESFRGVGSMPWQPVVLDLFGGSARSSPPACSSRATGSCACPSRTSGPWRPSRGASTSPRS